MWSYLVDRFNFKFSYTIVLVINVVFGFTLVLVSPIKPLFLVWMCMLAWAQGAHFSLIPAVSAKLFGKHSPIIFGIVFPCTGISWIVTGFLVKFCLHDIGYLPFYYGSATLSLFSLILLIFFFKEDKVC